MKSELIGRRLLRWLWPETCLRCREDLALEEEPRLICRSCRPSLAPLEQPFCRVCATPGVSGLCRACASGRPGIPFTRAAFLYKGAAVNLVHAFKFAERRKAARAAGDMMAAHWERFPELYPIDAVVPIPLHPRRLRERGYNQARLLAEAVRDTVRRPLADLLSRRKSTHPQWRLSRGRRRENMSGAFIARPQAAGMRLLLIDDVCTTGSTLREAALALREAGAERVCAYVFAREGLNRGLKSVSTTACAVGQEESSSLYPLGSAEKR